MRIGVNLARLLPGGSGGMEVYVRNLISHLGRIDETNDYFLILAPYNFRAIDPPSPRWKKVIYYGQETDPRSFMMLPRTGLTKEQRRWKTLRGILRRIRTLPHPLWTGSLLTRINDLNLDLWFSPLSYSLPVGLNIPAVNTIPDLQHEHFPLNFSEQELALRSLGYEYSCHSASATLSISHFVANELCENYGLDPAKVFATPLAVDDAFHITPDEIEHVKLKVKTDFRLVQPFLYYPANGWEHKNHQGLVRALAILRSKGHHCKLVLSGVPFDLMERIGPLIRELSLTEHVVHLGYIERSQLIGLYTLCEMLVFPSFHEGFGLPILEAMHFGTPVICSRAGSLLEVGGPAALYFDPAAPEEIAACAIRLLSDNALRARMVSAGKRHSSGFSFTDTAQQTLEVIGRAARGELRRPVLPFFNPPREGGWLKDGRCRIYFSANSLKGLRMELARSEADLDTSEARIVVLLDGEPIHRESLQPGQTGKISIEIRDETERRFRGVDIRIEDALDKQERPRVQLRSLSLNLGDGLQQSLIGGAALKTQYD